MPKAGNDVIELSVSLTHPDGDGYSVARVLGMPLRNSRISSAGKYFREN